MIEFNSSRYQIFVISLICISAEFPTYNGVGHPESTGCLRYIRGVTKRENIGTLGWVGHEVSDNEQTMMMWVSTDTGGRVHWGKSQVFCDIPDLWVGYTQIDTPGVFFSLRLALPIDSEYSVCMVDHIKLWSESTAIPATCTIHVQTERMNDQRKLSIKLWNKMCASVASHKSFSILTLWIDWWIEN